MNRSDDFITVELLNENLWQQFFAHGTEMILTKKGRHLFPTFEVLVYGLDPYSLYSIHLEFIQDSIRKYRFSGGSWKENGAATPLDARAIYRHEHSPKNGCHWMKSVISFRNAKISNNANEKNCVVLNSLCSYHIQLHVLKFDDTEEILLKVFDFPQTRFISVTAYQNAKVTQLKCKHNIFARRKNVPKKRKRDMCTSQFGIITDEDSFLTQYYPPSESPYEGNKVLSNPEKEHKDVYNIFDYQFYNLQDYPEPYSEKISLPTNFSDFVESDHIPSSENRSTLLGDEMDNSVIFNANTAWIKSANYLKSKDCVDFKSTSLLPFHESLVDAYNSNFHAQ